MQPSPPSYLARPPSWGREPPELGTKPRNPYSAIPATRDGQRGGELLLSGQRGGEFDSLWVQVGAEAVGAVLKETKDKKLLLYFR